ncbi:MAG: glycosyltransferase [Deferrisoma sp.]
MAFGRGLRERGHRVLGIVRAGNPFEQACRKAGFTVYPVRFGPKYNPVAIWRLVRIFRRERPEVVVVNISRDLEIGAVAARVCGIPVVHRVGLVEDFRGTLEERWQHRVLVTRVLVPAEWMGAELARRFPWIESGRIRVVRNGRPAVRLPSAWVRKDAPVVFGTASQLSPSKGHHSFLRAAGILASEGVSFRIRVAGSGALEGELRQQTAQEGLSDRVEFVGFVKDMQTFLAQLDVFVLASLKEGLPNALLEAMAAGLPCIASDLPGTREVGGDAVLLVPPGDAPALARAMRRLSTDAEFRGTLAREAAARVRKCFDLDTQVGVLERVLREVAGP